MDQVYVNGKWLPAGSATVDAADRGLLYGYGLFETLRVRRGRPALVERHLDRLFRSAPVLGLDLPWDTEALAGLVADCAARNGVAEGGVRLTVTAGPGPAFAPGGGAPGLVLTARRGPLYPEDAYARGYRAAIATVRRNHRSPLAGVKSLNCLDNLLARREAAARGADEALLLNVDGELAEGAATNLFFVRRGRLCTPEVECGALPGVARGVVLERASGGAGGSPGLPGVMAVEAGRYGPEALLEADEAFLTNALMGVMPLVAVDGRPVGDGRPGPTTSWLRIMFEERGSV